MSTLNKWLKFEFFIIQICRMIGSQIRIHVLEIRNYFGKVGSELFRERIKFSNTLIFFKLIN
jgi:hypothetical protein